MYGFYFITFFLALQLEFLAGTVNCMLFSVLFPLLNSAAADGIHRNGSGEMDYAMRRTAAFFMTLVILLTSLSCPLLAAPSSSSSQSSSSSASSSESSSSSASSSSGESSSPDAEQPASSSKVPTEDNVYSHAAYMVNLDSGTVLFEKNAQERIWPASLTKIMTCIVALEEVGDIDKETTSLSADIQTYLYNLGGVSLGDIRMGETFTIHQLLYAMMLQSANEAAMMVGSYVGKGDLDVFIEKMNQKAKEIGAKNTHFSNTTGLHDEDNYSTAYDLALITEYAMKNPIFAELVTALYYDCPPTEKHPNGVTWSSINYMQQVGNEYYYEGIKGVKTGSLPDSDVGGGGIRNFISTCTRNGYTYLTVCVGAPQAREDGLRYEKNLAFVDTRNLYNWAFENFTVKTLMDVGDEVAEVPVRLSWDVDHIKLLAGGKFASLVANEVTEDSLQKLVEIPENIDAPVTKGDEVGYVKLMLNGEEVGRVNLLAAQSVERSSALYYADVVKSFLSTFLFKFVLTFVIVILVLYTVLMIIRNRNRRRYRMRRKRPPMRR